jgi:hypothetical protein
VPIVKPTQRQKYTSTHKQNTEQTKQKQYGSEKQYKRNKSQRKVQSLLCVRSVTRWALTFVTFLLTYAQNTCA